MLIKFRVYQVVFFLFSFFNNCVSPKAGWPLLGERLHLTLSSSYYLSQKLISRPSANPMTLKHGLDHYTGEQVDRSTTRDVALSRTPDVDSNRGPLIYELNVLPLCHYCLFSNLE